MIHSRQVICVVMAGWTLAACAGADHAMPEVSESEHAEAVQQVLDAPDLLPTTRTAEENERIARQVVRNLQAVAKPICEASDWARCWYTLRFSPSGQINAYIMKNHIVLSNGLAQYLETEHEFAAVLAHEMAHDIAGHYEKTRFNQSMGGLLASVVYATAATAAGQSTYRTSADMGTAYSVGAKLGVISFSKAHEREADYIGAYLMTRAGYDPDKGKALWVTLTKAGGALKTTLMATHPSGPDRLAAWEKTVEEVRYSQDLMPNLAGQEPEARLQVARAFDGGPVDTAPVGSAVALAAAVAKGGEAVGNFEPTGSFESGGFGLVAGGAKAAGNSVWTAGGEADGCGARWRLDVETRGSEVRGNMWWKGVKYEVYGNLDHKGRTTDARAGKSKDYQTMPAPRFFRLDLAFEPRAARGSFAIDSSSAGCWTEFALRPSAG